MEWSTPGDVGQLRQFLHDADLTVSGLEAGSARLWVTRDGYGAIIGSAGYELSGDARQALIRSVAVAPSSRSAGLGSRLARFALWQAAEAGAESAWLFSRRSGPFWQRLGFAAASRDELAEALAETHQVQQFARTGQLDQEQAWHRRLDDHGSRTPATSSPARRGHVPG